MLHLHNFAPLEQFNQFVIWMLPTRLDFIYIILARIDFIFIKFCVARERSIEDIEMSKANFIIIKGNKDNSTYRAKTVTATSDNSGKIELKWRAPEVRM